MIRRQTYRCYPTPEQAESLAKTFGCCRFAYNWALNLRTERHKAGEKCAYSQSSAALTALKKEADKAWLNEVSCVPLQQELRHLDTAFKNFFEKRSSYPKFKKKGQKDTAEFTRSAFSFDAENNRLILAKMDGVPLKIVWSRPLPSPPSSLTVVRKPSGKYFVSFVVGAPAPTAPKTGESIGIDFGISHLATLSNGEKIANPKHGDKLAKRLALEQRRLAKKKRVVNVETGKKQDSKRRIKQKRKVARVHERIADARKDALHKMTTDLVRRFDAIYIESLDLREMVKNHNLARRVQDASIGTAIQILQNKASAVGKQVVKIDRWFPSSKTCSACGHVLAALDLSVRAWTCPGCGVTHDRDVNAAKNILAVGKTVIAHGENVSAVGAKVPKARSQRSANRPVIS
jgi:putative transposase